jgi:hypothetical protein
MNVFAGFSKVEWRLVLQTQERLSCVTPSVIILSGVVKDNKIPTSQATWLLSMGKNPGRPQGFGPLWPVLIDKLFEKL